MTKKTPPHKKYEQLAKRLSLKSAQAANKLIENLLKLLQALKAVCIAVIRQKSGAINILNPIYGRLKQVVLG
jgi:hypothetical protein